MADETPKKPSLKGRGRDLMRGSSSDPNHQAAPDQPEDDATFFEDDESVMKWMETDPEALRPTLPPDQSLLGTVEDSEQALDLDAEPDFDAIFGEDDLQPTSDDEQISASAEAPEDFTQPQPSAASDGQTLDDLFTGDDPNFDDLFGDVAGVSDVTVPEPAPQANEQLTESLSDISTDELYTEELFNSEEGIPGFVENSNKSSLSSDEPASALSDMPINEDDLDDLPDFDDLLDEDFADDQEMDEPLLEADPIATSGRMQPRSDFVMEDAPTANLDDLLTKDEIENALDESATALADHTESTSEWLVEDFVAEHMPAEEDTNPETQPGEATAILNERFLDDEDDAPADENSRAAFDLLAEMTTELDEEPIETIDAVAEAPQASTNAESKPEAIDELDEPLSEAEAFVAMLESEEQEAVASLSPDDEMDNLLEQPDIETVDDEAADKESPVETMRGAADALSEPLELTGSDIQEPSPSKMPFALNLTDDLPPPPTLPERDSIRTTPVNQEANPLGEEKLESVDLSKADLSKAQIGGAPIEELVPAGPEVLPSGQLPPEMYEEAEEQFLPNRTLDDVLESVSDPLAEEIGGGTLIDERSEEDAETRNFSMMALAGSANSDEAGFLGERITRRRSEEIFTPSETTPNEELVNMFINDNRLRELFEQIEALQEEVVENVSADRRNTDTYQEELLQASNLLMQSRDNYDEARAVLMRIRADLRRDQKVMEDITRFRPILINLHIGIFILLVVLAALGQFFIGLAESAGAGWIGQGYYPALMGALGALLSGYFTLRRHTILQRDFDPIHTTEYIMNPVIGAIAGFLVYLFSLSISTVSLSDASAENTGLSVMTLLTAAAVGFNQNSLINLLNSARQRLVPENQQTPPNNSSGSNTR